MSSSQIAAIIVSILFTIFFITLFQKNRRNNHHQELKNEVIDSQIVEQSFEKGDEE
jgi:uncharacterized membrane protein